MDILLLKPEKFYLIKANNIAHVNILIYVRLAKQINHITRPWINVVTLAHTSTTDTDTLDGYGYDCSPETMKRYDFIREVPESELPLFISWPVTAKEFFARYFKEGKNPL